MWGFGKLFVRVVSLIIFFIFLYYRNKVLKHVLDAGKKLFSPKATFLPDFLQRETWKRKVNEFCDWLQGERFLKEVTRIAHYLLLATTAWLLYTVVPCLSSTFLGDCQTCSVLFLLATLFVLLSAHQMLSGTFQGSIMCVKAVAVILVVIAVLGWLFQIGWMYYPQNASNATIDNGTVLSGGTV